MATFEKGQTFLDLNACNMGGCKPKYFLALSNAEYEDDQIVCFVFNTEHRMDKLHLHCNSERQKFVFPPKSLTFLTEYSSLMLNIPCCYTLSEVCNSRVKLLDVVCEEVTRQVKNCIDWDYIPGPFQKLIKDSFKRQQ